MTNLPAPGTKTRDVLNCFEADEWLKARRVANRMDWVTIRNDVGAVSGFLTELDKRGLLYVDRSGPVNLYRKSLVARIETEMVVDNCHEAEA